MTKIFTVLQKRTTNHWNNFKITTIIEIITTIEINLNVT